MFPILGVLVLAFAAPHTHTHPMLVLVLSLGAILVSLGLTLLAAPYALTRWTAAHSCVCSVAAVVAVTNYVVVLKEEGDGGCMCCLLPAVLSPPEHIVRSSDLRPPCALPPTLPGLLPPSLSLCHLA